MRVLAVHNYYRQAGGEDVVFASECELLRERGNRVLQYSDSNWRIDKINPLELALGTVWSQGAYRRISKLIQRFRPDIAHFHNTFPLISPSAYYACKRHGVGVVQTLHNYRLICAGATLQRAGRVCEQCTGRFSMLPAIRHKCYHDSLLQTGVLIGSLLAHRLAGTFDSSVDAFVALTEFAKNKFIRAGISAQKMFVKSNFVNTSSMGPMEETHERCPFALFVGRFASEKGLGTLLSAWEQIDYPIYLFGSGVLPEFKKSENIKVMNFVDRATILSYMKRASLLIFPSEWYEGFPLTIAEAFSCSLPVLTSNIGSQAEIVKDGYSGVHFEAGNVQDLRNKVAFLLQHPQEMSRMGAQARKEYELKYSADVNYEILMDIYEKVLSDK